MLTEINNKLEILSQQIEKKDTKELYVCCSLHNHPMLETIVGKLNNPGYSNGFCCDVCKLTITDKNAIVYHCKNCENSTILFDTCESCVRKCLKV